ncbi:MAG TPA: DUF4142 domain-containing protein, partial [Labilithrix sp.]|nr:DUF4142 domain-containing protein [Labilithrix sp.]
WTQKSIQAGMNHRAYLSIAAAGLSLVFAAGCKKHDADQTSSTRTTSATGDGRPKTETQPKAAAAPLAKDDHEFLIEAAQANMLEIALGREVSRKATSPEVKAFAQRMVEDHGKANDELKQLAAKKGVTLPTELDKDGRETLDELSKLSGPKLDAEYSEEMAEDHAEDVKEFREAVQEVKDPDLRAWAAKTTPVLEGHLATARGLEAKTKR